jgi:hypothetical protein
MTRKREQPHSRERAHDSERWPVISNLDLRSKQQRHAIPFGAAGWWPRDDDNERIANKLVEIRDAECAMARSEGRAWLGLGSRQYAYRLKARGFIFADQRKLDKDDFNRVGRILVRMRRAGWIDWRDVSDGRGIFHQPVAYSDNSERCHMLAIYARAMSHDRMEGQKTIPELAVETEGLYNLIYDIADRYGARSNGLQGQSAVGPRRKLAERVAQRWERRVRTRVLCVADYDRHGDLILGAVAADAAQHLRDKGIEPDFCLQVIRIALTQRQISEHDIPLAEKDGRLVQEAEALPTDVLRAEVDAALRDTLDMKLFDRIAREKQHEIAKLAQKIGRLRVD